MVETICLDRFVTLVDDASAEMRRETALRTRRSLLEMLGVALTAEARLTELLENASSEKDAAHIKREQRKCARIAAKLYLALSRLPEAQLH